MLLLTSTSGQERGLSLDGLPCSLPCICFLVQKLRPSWDEKTTPTQHSSQGFQKFRTEGTRSHDQALPAT